MVYLIMVGSIKKALAVHNNQQQGEIGENIGK